MEIHNIMEEKVMRVLEEICREDENSDDSKYCTSDQCRRDAACFVLNRIPQRYVTSSRGAAHYESDLADDSQTHIDIVTLIHEGLRRVTTVQRKFYDEDDESNEVNDAPAYFNFPVIKGRLFNGLNFEPVINVNVEFRMDGQSVAMIDKRWRNPYPLVANTPGTFLFWPRSLETDAPGKDREFIFELVVHDENFEPFIHSFRLRLVSENHRSTDGMKNMKDFNMQDLFLLPLDDEIR